jgi:phosphate acetyltransferase
MSIIEEVKASARKCKKKIVLPETTDERTLKAADTVYKEEIADIILIGNPTEINQKASSLRLSHIHKATIINPEDPTINTNYSELLYELRKHKGITPDQAKQITKDPLYLGCLMIKKNDADGQVAGAIHATSDVIRPALQIIKTKPGINIVSSCFMMVLPDKNIGSNGVLFYGDCGLNINPDENELAEIAITTASSAKSIAGIDPFVAMLCFSTKGSASHQMADKVINATKIAQKRAPNLKIDGELQGDAALVEKVAAKKAPNSPVAGKANVLIFPDLNAGNIGYKLTERLAGAIAIGPILQGIARPVNDLSRGCSVDDIVTSVAITVNQAAEDKIN